jgi:hypothetical protein
VICLCTVNTANIIFEINIKKDRERSVVRYESYTAGTNLKVESKALISKYFSFMSPGKYIAGSFVKQLNPHQP